VASASGAAIAGLRGAGLCACIVGSRRLGKALNRRSPVAFIYAGRWILTKDRIVAVGLLTQRDLDVLGSGFHRLFSVAADEDADDGFADLIAELDKIEAITPDPRYRRR
jgi:hypothetical protein